MWKTFGHDAVKTILARQILSGSFAHAYLFTGPEGVGKKTLAYEFAEKICEEKLAVKKGLIESYDANQDFGVEQIRYICKNASLTPLYGKHKIIIIDNFEFVSESSANALLKTLEEPSEGTVFVLVANTPNVLATVQSRCQVFRLNRLTEKQLMEFAISHKLKATAEILNLSNGSIHKLMELLLNEKAKEKSLSDNSLMHVLVKKNFGQRMLELKTMSDLEDFEMRELFINWLFASKGYIKNVPANVKITSSIIEAINLLNSNVNKKFILERMFLQW